MEYLHQKILDPSSSEEEKYSDDEDNKLEGVKERIHRKIKELKDATEDNNREEDLITFDVKELLRSDAEYFRKLKMSKAISGIESDSQKLLVATRMLDDSSTAQGQELRNAWIIKTVQKKTEEEQFDDGGKQWRRPYSKNAIILEGQLQKQSSGMLKSWKNVNCVLLGDRLEVYKIGTKEKLKKSILFGYFQTSVEFSEKEHEILIRIEACDVSLRLRGGVEGGMNVQECYRILSLAVQAKSNKNYIMDSKIMNSLCKLNGILEDQFVQEAQSGDVLLFQTKSLMAKLQRATTSSQYDHVGLLIKLKDGILRVFEAVGDGVSITEWNQFVYENGQYASIVYRPLHYSHREEILPELYQFVESTIGSSYSLTLAKLYKVTSFANQNDKKPKAYFCSELVAKAFKEVGLINQITASSQYWPRSFSSDYDYLELKLYDSAYLMPERQILLSIEVTNK